MGSQLSANIAVERLEYKESEKDTRTESKAKLNHLVLGVEVSRRGDPLVEFQAFCSLEDGCIGLEVPASR